MMEDKNYVFYPVKNKEGVVINTDNDFELALVLKKKQENRPNVLKMIDRIISEKQKCFREPIKEKSVCLVGHSQFDQWNVDNLAGYKVRNCGVSGISSFEYNEKILKPALLNCEADCFLIMHGTNDIVWDYSINEMIESICKTIEYIKARNCIAPIIFVSCIHVNGRLDRSNARIDKLNENLKKVLEDKVTWIDTSFMDDQYGELKEEYTKDGLHLSDEGYRALRNEIELKMKGLGL